MRDYLVVIPARYQSSRLPGKPLVELLGTPMIVHTFRQCAKAVNEQDIVVALDDDRVEAICEAHGIQTLRTSENCLTGTDRVAETARAIPAQTYVNVQGDEPLFAPDDILKLIRAAQDYPDRIINGYCAIDQASRFRSSHVPKVVFRPDGRLLYMSRAGIPGNKKNEFEAGWRQVCAYALPPQALAAFAANPEKTPLEFHEDIEILRFLELGFDVHMIELSADSISVDTPDDIERAEAALRLGAS